MFWSSKKKIPAPQNQRYDLARKLYLQRLVADPSLIEIARMMGADARDFTGEQVFSYGFPEGMIIALTEHYLSLRERGCDEAQAVGTINAHFGQIPFTDGTYPPQPSASTDFINYLRSYCTASSRGKAQISDQVLISHFKEVKAFYKR